MSFVCPTTLLLGNITSSRSFSLPSLIRAADHVYQCSKYSPLPWYSGSLLWDGVDLPAAADAFCVSQSITTTPFSGDHMVKDIIRNTNNNSPATFQNSMSINKVGNSSITYSHTIAYNDEAVANLSRTFVRVNAAGALPFTAQEKQVLDNLCDPSPSPCLSSPTKRYLEPNNVFSLKIASEHVNFGGHVDHAALSSIALAGIETLTPGTQPTVFNINYAAQARLGDIVEISVDHCPEADGGMYWDARVGKSIICFGLTNDFTVLDHDHSAFHKPLFSSKL